jgi:hypothetical protein
MVLRYLATVIRVCAPSDLVAYRQHHHHYNGDPVVSHFACSFKYPHHLNEYVEELPEFWHQYPRNDSQRKHRRWKPRALVGVLYRAATNARTNKWVSRAMSQMSTALPQSLTRQRLWRKMTPEELEVYKECNEDEFAQLPLIAQIGDNGEYYHTDADDDTPNSATQKAATAAVSDIRDALKDKVHETTRIRTMGSCWEFEGSFSNLTQPELK